MKHPDTEHRKEDLELKHLDSPVSRILHPCAFILGIIGPVLIALSSVYFLSLAFTGGNVVESLFKSHYSAFLFWTGIACSLLAFLLVFISKAIDRSRLKKKASYLAEQEWLSRSNEKEEKA